MAWTNRKPCCPTERSQPWASSSSAARLLLSWRPAAVWVVGARNCAHLTRPAGWSRARRDARLRRECAGSGRRPRGRTGRRAAAGDRVVDVEEVDRQDAGCLRRTNCRQLVSVCRDGAGGIQWCWRIRRIVEAPTRCPSLSSSHGIVRYPQLRFSMAIRTTSATMMSLIGGAVRAGSGRSSSCVRVGGVPTQDGVEGDKAAAPKCSARNVRSGASPTFNRDPR